MAKLVLYSLICILGIYLITKKDFFRRCFQNKVVFGEKQGGRDHRLIGASEGMSTEDSMAMDAELEMGGYEVISKV